MSIRYISSNELNINSEQLITQLRKFQTITAQLDYIRRHIRMLAVDETNSGLYQTLLNIPEISTWAV